MLKLLTTGFWKAIARLILRNKISIILLVLLGTFLLGLQWKNMRFTHTEANLLPDDHEVNIVYNSFLEIFGEEGNLVIIGIKDSSLFKAETFNAWNRLAKTLEAYNEVEQVVSINNLQKLQKNSSKRQFELVPFISDTLKSDQAVTELKKELFNNYPFYDNFLYNTKTQTVRTAIYLNKEIVNTSKRKDFILNDLNRIIDDFEKRYHVDVRVSGMPYIRTLNSQNIVDEMEIFIIAALLVTSFIFFLFFRSFRATFIS